MKRVPDANSKSYYTRDSFQVNLNYSDITFLIKNNR